MPFIPTACLATKAIFIQTIPIPIRIVHSHLFASSNAFTDKDDAHGVKPSELLELCIGITRVIYEAGVVAVALLVDLEDAVRTGRRGCHDVRVGEGVREKAGKFANGGTAFEWLQGA